MLRKTMPVARRLFEKSNDLLIKMRTLYARALYDDPAATLEDILEAVTTLEDIERITRRVLGGAHPLMKTIELHLRAAQAALRAREAPPTSA